MRRPAGFRELVVVGRAAEVGRVDVGVRIGPGDVVHDVEDVHAEFEAEAFDEGEALDERGVHVELLGPADVVVLPGVVAGGEGGQQGEGSLVEPLGLVGVVDVGVTVDGEGAEADGAAGAPEAGGGDVPAAEDAVDQAVDAAHVFPAVAEGDFPGGGGGKAVAGGVGVDPGVGLGVLGDVVEVAFILLPVEVVADEDGVAAGKVLLGLDLHRLILQVAARLAFRDVEGAELRVGLHQRSGAPTVRGAQCAGNLSVVRML